MNLCDMSQQQEQQQQVVLIIMKQQQKQNQQDFITIKTYCIRSLSNFKCTKPLTTSQSQLTPTY